MARELAVYWAQNRVGVLAQDTDGSVSFTYDKDWLERADVVSPISRSLPLQAGAFGRNPCHAFFAGLLPEERHREIIAKRLGISARNDIALLEKIGGDCGGALSFLPTTSPPPTRDDKYYPLTDAELETILGELPTRPLLAGREGVRLSLAGAQDKLPVAIIKGVINLPLGNSSSTHIIKPALPRFPDIVGNEHYCLTLARSAGLDAAPTEIRRVGKIEYLLITRYDRVVDNNGKVSRLHQEDFCQALGFAPERKYQAEGGPSFKDCFTLVRDATTIPAVDLNRLCDLVIFNYFAGNNDAHGKNFSLLYKPVADGVAPHLAPAYDLVSTAAYPELSTRMAMKIGGAIEHNDVAPQDWEKFAAQAGLNAPLTLQRVREMAGKLLRLSREIPAPDEGSRRVAEIVGEECGKMLARFA